MPFCPICKCADAEWYAKTRDIEYQTSNDTFEFYHCKDCDVLFIHPMPANRLDEIYPENYYSFAAMRRSLPLLVKEQLDRRRFRQVLRAIPGEHISILDVGGGVGWLADIVKSADPRVDRTHIVDIDPIAESAAVARGHSFTRARFEEFDTSERFDLILMLNLIEHVADPAGVLAHARSLLSPRGRLLLKTPNFDALDARIFRHRSWGGYHTPRHFVLFKRASLESLCTKCGFEVASFNYTQGAPFWSVSILEELRRLGLARISRQRPAIYHPLMPLLQAAGASIDMVRAPFAKLSQMELVLRLPQGSPSRA